MVPTHVAGLRCGSGRGSATSLLVFYRVNPFPDTRLTGIGSLTNTNEFANVYGIFALLAMGFALQTRKLVCKAPFLLAIVVFVCFVWFGQSRTAFFSC